MAPEVFISHRHDDRKLADAIRKHLQLWGIKKKSIFQSSDAQGGSRIGDPLSQALQEALHKANLVLLIYTFSDEDWAYVMWEAGVATDPAKATRIIVFQCTDDRPKPFQDQVRVRITKEDILRFATQFHKDKDFVPGDPAWDPEIDEGTLRERSDRLYDSLFTRVPAGKLEELSRWDALTLELAPKFVAQVKKIKDAHGARNILEKNLVVSREYGQPARHFGFNTFTLNPTFANCVDRWREMTGKNAADEWIDGLCAEIWRAINNIPSEPTWEYLRSAVPGADWWLYPVLNHARVLRDKTMEFDLYLYQGPGP